MISHIHILGASGSGTTTLGEELSKRLGYVQKLLKEQLDKQSQWILTDWGDMFIPYFDLVIYLCIPQDIWRCFKKRI